MLIKRENFNSMKLKQRRYKEKEKSQLRERKFFRCPICRLKERGVSQVAISKQFDISEANRFKYGA